MINYIQMINECGIEVDRGDFIGLNEAAKIQVTDEVLNGMFKLITDKYNSLDFSEIEKSAGDIRRFKYYSMLRDNAATLRNIYEASTDPSAKVYIEVIDSIDKVLAHLMNHSNQYSTLYKSGNGLIQLMYTSLVAAVIYSTSILISNTIQFVTSEEDTDCEVLFNEIPGTVKHIHIKNIKAAANDITAFEKVLNEYSKQSNIMHESISATTLGAVALGVAGVIFLIPRIIALIREIIYSIYYKRVKISEELGIQADLIRVNIESLEAGRGSKKVIAKQRKIAEKLTKWQNKIAIKVDTTNTLTNAQKNKENAAMRVDRNSPFVQAPGTFDAEALML